MPLDTDMRFRMIQVGSSVIPMIYPQSWDEEMKEWAVTTEDSPLSVDNMDFNDFLELLSEIKQEDDETISILTQAVNTFQGLIDNSIPKEGEDL